MRCAPFAGALLSSLLALGCTARYSHILVGRISRFEGLPITNSDSGIELGLGAPILGVNVITFSEPMPALELVTPACEVELTQIDYRGTWYAYYVIANFPQVEAVSYCVVPPEPGTR